MSLNEELVTRQIKLGTQPPFGSQWRRDAKPVTCQLAPIFPQNLLPTPRTASQPPYQFPLDVPPHTIEVTRFPSPSAALLGYQAEHTRVYSYRQQLSPPHLPFPFPTHTDTFSII